MRSPFFWRTKCQATTEPLAGKPVVAIVPVAQLEPAVTPVPAAAAQPPAMRQVYALALQDERAIQPQIAPDPAQMSLLLAASQAFAQIGTEPRYTPRRPAMLAQLLQALSDENASLRELSRIVAKDPQLTGNLLRTANSVFYNTTGTPVESVERAAAMLGTAGIRRLLAASLMQPLATGPASEMGLFVEIIWEHALYSASASEAWVSHSQDADPFIAHLLALVHGLGCVAVYRVLTDLYAARPELQRDPATIADALETNAAVIASRIAAHWGLSVATQQALETQSSAAPNNEPSKLARALQFGLLSGAMIMLCARGKLTEPAGLEGIEAGGFQGTASARIWERLVRAYVRP
ncbi:MAG: HDOD domain-containing protein [Steroidobacteraceae bacterium]